jgi:hypothetical protein
MGLFKIEGDRKLTLAAPFKETIDWYETATATGGVTKSWEFI